MRKTLTSPAGAALAELLLGIALASMAVMVAATDLNGAVRQALAHEATLMAGKAQR